MTAPSADAIDAVVAPNGYLFVVKRRFRRVPGRVRASPVGDAVGWF
jgi:hypothetical protein